jgi:aspartyl-tRNA(Asn)/glutamyl-tRNA(Gln) amidotransferase subunit A
LQLQANHFDEARLLLVAHRFQQATEWHLRAPQSVARDRTIAGALST